MTKPYPWYYAVNDRPVQLAPVSGGGVDCLVLDLHTGNFVPDRSYFAHVAPGSGKDVDALDATELAQRVAAVRARLVHTWAERLCGATSTDERGLVQALGVPLEPPPLGATRATVSGGIVPNVDLELPAGVLTRADLDARLGAPRTLPRTGPHAAHVLAYAVTTANAPRQCTVFASFAVRPVAETSVTRVLLRVDG